MIEFKNVKKDYQNFKLDINLKVNKGEILLLVGKNASGKTSTIKLLLGVNEKDYGSINISEKNVTVSDKNNIGLVLSDSFFSLDFTVKEIANVLKNTYKKFDSNLFYAYLEKFELPVNLKLKKYSLGMLAKLKLISAICHKANILVLDEPTLGLDLTSREKLLEIIRDYMDDEKAIIISSHLTHEFEKLCDRAVFIDDGKIVYQVEIGQIDEDFAIVKQEEIEENIDKNDVLYKNTNEYTASYLIKNRNKYIDKNIYMEKAHLDDLVRAIYKKGEEI